MLWSGGPDSAVDLHVTLPFDGSWSSSEGFSIDDAGNVFGIAAGTYHGSFGIFAVEWSAVPEPTTATATALSIGIMTRRSRRRRV